MTFILFTYFILLAMYSNLAYVPFILLCIFIHLSFSPRVLQTEIWSKYNSPFDFLFSFFTFFFCHSSCRKDHGGRGSGAELKREVEGGLTFTLTSDLPCLYFICERKCYARTHVKVTGHWKSTSSTKFQLSYLYIYLDL